MNILAYIPDHRPAIRRILERTGWAEQYIAGAEGAAEAFSRDTETCCVYVAVEDGTVAGFVSTQYYAWNRLAQLHGLAVDPAYRQRGIATVLVAKAEEFTRSKNGRGVYVDTPVSNTGGRKFYEAIGYRFGYRMPRYYEDRLDGVTYQKFFDAV